MPELVLSDSSESEGTQPGEPKRPSRGLILAVAVVSALSLVGVWAASLRSTAGQGHRPVGPPRHHVEYRVGGTGTEADLIYVSPAGDLAQRANVRVPLGAAGADPVITLDVPSGSFVSIAAQARDEGAVDIACEVTVDGTRLLERHASGHLVLVDCSGIVP
jgi:hypothetical protein